MKRVAEHQVISAIVLCAEETRPGQDAREIVVRSLVWLVSAVVAGVVRDVTIAVPTRLDLGEIADRVGCEIVHADDEAGRLHGAADKARSGKLLVMRAGYQPNDQMIQEIDLFGTRGALSYEQTAVLLAEPTTFVERLVPSLAPVIGVLASKERVLGARSFADLVRASKGSTRLSARARLLQ